MTTVLVTDADYKHALAAIRNLGRHGVRVVAGAARTAPRPARGLTSRYASARFRYPSPTSDGPGFVDALAAAARQFGVDVLLPIGDASVVAVARNRERLPPDLAIPISAWTEGVAVAADKRMTVELASALEMPVPRVYPAPEAADLFPVVIKPTRGSGHVRYLSSAADPVDFDPAVDICQEYIEGEGYAYFGLFDHGVERAYFMHRRIREFPPTGGPSTAAESFSDPMLRELGTRILQHLRWHGVAMVEFKRDRKDGLYKLMEINPKFWGSLDLAIECGVEFPWLAVGLALGEAPASHPAYKAGVRFQWIFEDLVHATVSRASLPSVLRDLTSREVRHDFRRDDPLPFIAAGLNTGGWAAATAMTRARRSRAERTR